MNQSNNLNQGASIEAAPLDSYSTARYIWDAERRTPAAAAGTGELPPLPRLYSEMYTAREVQQMLGDYARTAIAADRAQQEGAAVEIESHMKRCDEMRDALYEAKREIAELRTQLAQQGHEPAGFISVCDDEIALSLTSPQREKLLGLNGAAVYLAAPASAQPADVSVIDYGNPVDKSAAPQPAAREAVPDAVAAMERAKKLPVWDDINHDLHKELDIIFKALAPSTATVAEPAAPAEADIGSDENFWFELSMVRLQKSEFAQNERAKKFLVPFINRWAAAPAAQQAAPSEPRGWLAGDELFYASLAAAQRACDEHNAYERSRPDFDEADLREPEPVFSAAPATAGMVGQDAKDTALRNTLLDEIAEKLEAMNDSSGDAAAYDNREQNIYELEREHAIAACVQTVRAMKSKGGQQ